MKRLDPGALFRRTPHFHPDRPDTHPRRASALIPTASDDRADWAGQAWTRFGTFPRYLWLSAWGPWTPSLRTDALGPCFADLAREADPLAPLAVVIGRGDAEPGERLFRACVATASDTALLARAGKRALFCSHDDIAYASFLLPGRVPG